MLSVSFGMNTECLQYTYTRLSIQCKSLISVDFAAKRTRNLGMYWPILAILLPSYALFRRGCAEQETRICLPVPAVPAQDILQEKNGKLVILWIDFREDIFPVHFYSESENNSLREVCKKSKWKFKMAFAMKGGGLEGVSRATYLFCKMIFLKTI